MWRRIKKLSKSVAASSYVGGRRACGGSSPGWRWLHRHRGYAPTRNLLDPGWDCHEAEQQHCRIRKGDHFRMGKRMFKLWQKWLNLMSASLRKGLNNLSEKRRAVQLLLQDTANSSPNLFPQIRWSLLPCRGHRAVPLSTLLPEHQKRRICEATTVLCKANFSLKLVIFLPFLRLKRKEAEPQWLW